MFYKMKFTIDDVLAQEAESGSQDVNPIHYSDNELNALKATGIVEIILYAFLLGVALYNMYYFVYK